MTSQPERNTIGVIVTYSFLALMAVLLVASIVIGIWGNIYYNTIDNARMADFKNDLTSLGFTVDKVEMGYDGWDPIVEANVTVNNCSIVLWRSADQDQGDTVRDHSIAPFKVGDRGAIIVNIIPPSISISGNDKNHAQKAAIYTPADIPQTACSAE